jgi:Tol biopolymer transport system component
MYWTRADGGGRHVRLMKEGLAEWFTPDGKRLGYVEVGTPGRPCRVVTLEGDAGQPRAGKPEPCFESDSEARPSSILSPDGRWIAYASLASGKSEVYVRRFPDRGGRWQISTSGGSFPKWSADGRAIFYIDDAESRLMIVPVQLGTDSLTLGQPQPWADSQLIGAVGYAVNYSPSPDGRRVLLLANPTGESRHAHIQVLLNFFDEIRRRLQNAAAK